MTESVRIDKGTDPDKEAYSGFQDTGLAEILRKRGIRRVFIGGLASTNLVRLALNGDKVVGEERLLTDLQPKRERIRDVRQGPDGALYLVTDEAQGRLLKLVPSARK